MTPEPVIGKRPNKIHWLNKAIPLYMTWFLSLVTLKESTSQMTSTVEFRKPVITQPVSFQSKSVV